MERVHLAKMNQMRVSRPRVLRLVLSYGLNTSCVNAHRSHLCTIIMALVRQSVAVH